MRYSPSGCIYQLLEIGLWCKVDFFLGESPLVSSYYITYSQISSIVYLKVFFMPPLALSCDRQHLSYAVCLEVRAEIISTVVCCIVYWSTVISTLRWAVLTGLWIGFCHNGPISHRYICVYFVCFHFILHSCCIIVNTFGWTWCTEA